MKFNLKYLMLPLGIITCINNNGNCMIDQSANLIIDGSDIDDTGISPTKFVEIMQSFANEDTKNLSGKQESFIQKLAKNIEKHDWNKDKDTKTFDKLLDDNKKLSWDQVLPYLRANATDKIDYSKSYSKFIESIKTCYDKGVITKKQYHKLLDNLLHYNLMKYFEGFDNKESEYKKNMYKVFNVGDTSKYDNSIFRTLRKIFNERDSINLKFIKEIINNLILIYIDEYGLNKKQEVLIKQMKQTIPEYIMHIIHNAACYGSEISRQLNITKEIEKQIEIYKHRIDLLMHIRMFKDYAKIGRNYNKDNYNAEKQQYSKFNMSDSIFSNGIFHFMDSETQRTNAISTYIPKINCNNNYNEAVFSNYIKDIVTCYNKFKESVKMLSQQENNEITNEIKKILNNINGVSEDINMDTTIGDLINIEQKLVQQAKLLENNKHNMEDKKSKTFRIICSIIDSIDVITNFVCKINKEKPDIMKLTLQDLINGNRKENNEPLLNRITRSNNGEIEYNKIKVSGNKEEEKKRKEENDDIEKDDPSKRMLKEIDEKKRINSMKSKNNKINDNSKYYGEFDTNNNNKINDISDYNNSNKFDKNNNETDDSDDDESDDGNDLA